MIFLFHFFIFLFFCLCMCLSACSEFWVLFVFGFAIWFLGCFGLVGCAKITDCQFVVWLFQIGGCSFVGEE